MCNLLPSGFRGKCVWIHKPTWETYLNGIWLLMTLVREGNGKPLQCSCLENPVDRGAWRAAVHRSHRIRHDWSNLACMHALEKEVAARSSVPAWRIPGTAEPGGLPSRVAQSRPQLRRLSSGTLGHVIFARFAIFQNKILGGKYQQV